MNHPIVSVVTLTYNHALFLRQCLDGILMQKTSFPFELLIHDDASTDETANIIREYESRFPDIIKPIYETENLVSLKKRGVIKEIGLLMNILIPRAQGKYIAWCEGDDYWTNPLKLQKQVDFLDTHPDYTICGGMYWMLNQMNNEGNTELTEREWFVREMAKYPKGKTINLDNFMLPYAFQFLTVCFRKDAINKLFQIRPYKDDTIFAVLLEQGKGYIFHDYLGVYRQHKEGMWSKKTLEEQMRSTEKFLQPMLAHFGNKSKSIRHRYFLTCIHLRFIELKSSKHPVIDFLKILRFTFSGKIKDIFTFQIYHLRLFSWKYLSRGKVKVIMKSKKRLFFKRK